MLPQNNSDSACCRVLSNLLPAGVACRVLEIKNYTNELSQSETELITGTSEKRQNEFSTGRKCAKDALAKLGVRDIVILRNEHREPVWPDGIVGSITHCRDLCGSVVSYSNNMKCIGFDIENLKPLTQDISKYVCTQIERDWLAMDHKPKRETLLILLFSLKEAVFKCVFPLHAIHFGFKDCIVKPDLNSGTAEVEFLRDDIKTRLQLQFRLDHEHVYSIAYQTAGNNIEI